MSTTDKFKLPERLTPHQRNIWIEYTQLSTDYNPIDLGTGFPDYLPPNDVTKALERVARGDNLTHQYTRDYGHPRLVNALSRVYSRVLGRELDPQNEILTTVGAYEALFSAVIGHVDFGDEVIIVEPFFDCYEPMVRIAGGTPRFIPLRRVNFSGGADDWVLDKAELESLFNSRTKIIILNNPHNPLGKVFRVQELEFVAELCRKWNVLCISDEVYEWIVYRPNRHVKIATLPGMWERTITIGSAGKTFSVTGWKLGWAYGPSNLLYNLQMVHQNSVYTGNTPMQEAVAVCFEKELTRFGNQECYFNSIGVELEEKRDRMVEFLREIGMEPVVPDGGYFMVADWSSLESGVDLSSERDEWKDYRFTKWMTKNVGVQGIPPSAFYSREHKTLAEHLVRFCFFKKKETLETAAKVLTEWHRARF